MATNDNKRKYTKGKYAQTKRSAPSRSKTTTRTAPTNSTIRTNPVTGKTSTVSRKKKHKKRNNFKLDFEKLYNKISKKDVKWYWDIRKWSPILIVLILIFYVSGCNNGEANKVEYYESLPPETIYIEVTQPAEVTEETEPVRDEEAVALAILADTSAAGKSREVKRILMWVAINRTEDRANGYGGTLLEEIARPKQWQGYDPNGMYLLDTYDLAVEVLDIWRNNGPRPLYNDMLWSVYNADGTITVRNRFGNQKGRMEQTYG